MLSHIIKPAGTLTTKKSEVATESNSVARIQFARDEKSEVTSKSQNNANSASCVNSARSENAEILRKSKKIAKTLRRKISAVFPPSADQLNLSVEKK